MNTTTENGPKFRDRSKVLHWSNRIPTWLTLTGPLVLLGLVIWGILAIKPLEVLHGEDLPPVEELTVTHTVLPRPGLIELYVVNGGPDPVTIAQVMVDEAYWSFWMESGNGATNDPSLKALAPAERAAELERRQTVDHLGRARIMVPYPWVSGEAHEVVLVSETGATFPSEIEVAVESSAPTAGYFGLFALLGLLVGVIPVYLGLGWYPLIRRLSERTINILLCFAVGLLAFLLIDTAVEAFETAGQLPEIYGGIALIVLGTVGSMLVLTAVDQWLTNVMRQRRIGGEHLALASMIAFAIGLHNLGEGLAIGGAFNLGAVSLGAMLIIGFTLHNITEGLAIVAPLGRSKVRLAQLGWLGLLAGGPTVLGGWAGAFAYSPVWSVIFLAIGAGAISQVVVQICRQIAPDDWRGIFKLPSNIGSLAAGYTVMYVTGLFVAV
jgi:zinc transporter, ZIP family